MRASCVICSDLYDDVTSIVSGSCGHCFHEDCIKKWIKTTSNNSQSCPECRKKLTFQNLTKLYFNIAPLPDTSDGNYFENAFHNNEAKLKLKDQEIEILKDEKSQLKCYCVKAEDEVETLKQNVHKLNSEITSLKLILKHYKKNASQKDELEITNKSLVEKIEFYQNIRTVIDGTQKDIEEVLNSTANNTQGVKQMATYCSLLKRELNNIADSKQKLSNELAYLRKTSGTLNLENKNLVKERDTLKEQVQSLEKKNLSLTAKNVANSLNKTPLESDVVFESPVPERLKRKSNDLDENEEVITPVSERHTIEPFPFRKRNFKVFVGNPLQSRTPLISKNIPHSESKLLQASMKIAPKEDDSIIRVGYNGLGGHSKHIFKSKPSGASGSFMRNFKKL